MKWDNKSHVTDLRRELQDEREKVTSYTRSRARTTSLERELENVREKHQRKTQEQNTEIKNMREAHERKTQELNAEIKTLRHAFHDKKNVSTQPQGKSGKTKRSKREASKDNVTKDIQDTEKVDENFEARLASVRELCEQKDRTIEELRTTCIQLQHQRQEMLVEKERAESRRIVEENSQEKLDVLSSENRQVRDQLSQVTVEMDQQRVR
jgi:chromosome segregation ATPase